MRVTHRGHACVLVEVAGTRILVDPGSYSDDLRDVAELDAILLTHQHPDHVEEQRLTTLLAASPDALVLAEPATASQVEAYAAVSPQPRGFRGGDSTTVGAVTIEGVGRRHALIHDGLDRIDNTGFVISAAGEPALFHPGDAYDGEPPRQVDVLALPLNAPWAAIRDTVAFARRIAARWEFPIHDGLLNATGRSGYLRHVRDTAPTGTEVVDLSDRQPWTVG